MPRYRRETQFEHGAIQRVGVLIANLGTPDAPTTGAVRRYLREFLSDPRLIELPRVVWLLILHGVILRIRPRRSAEAYQKVWTDEGSPLLFLNQRLVEKLRTALPESGGRALIYELGMSYGSPALTDALERLHQQNICKLVVLPLYPQYSATTTGSVFDQVARWIQGTRRIPDLTLLSSYHDRPAYIKALAASIRSHWESHGRGDRLLFSFHGIPRRYLESGDPYHCHCLKTARLVATELGLSEDAYFLSFQSRVGREEWLRPYTDELLIEWGQQATGVVDVVCPGFSVDCLETLEEIAMQNRENYQEAGGEDLRYIPCLNDSDAHVSLLAEMLAEQTQTRPVDDADVRDRQARQAVEAGAKR